MDVDCVRIIQRTDLLQHLFSCISSQSIPVFTTFVQNEVQLKFWLQLFEFLSEDNVLFLLVCEQKN